MRQRCCSIDCTTRAGTQRSASGGLRGVSAQSILDNTCKRVYGQGCVEACGPQGVERVWEWEAQACPHLDETGHRVSWMRRPALLRAAGTATWRAYPVRNRGEMVGWCRLRARSGCHRKCTARTGMQRMSTSCGQAQPVMYTQSIWRHQALPRIWTRGTSWWDCWIRRAGLCCKHRP